MTLNPTGAAVIVDPYSSGAFYADAFRKFGLPVVAVMSAPEPPDVYAASFRPTDFDQILVAPRNDLGVVVSTLKALGPRCLLTGCESGVELTDRLAQSVLPALANDPRKASARRHKGEMARALAEAGVPGMKQICSDSADEVEDWIEREGLCGCDLVIKPPKSASTDGVVKVAQGAGWRVTFSRMLGSVNRLGGCNDTLMVQEFLRGVEYAVDTVSYGGAHSVASICRYNKTDNGPFMAIYNTMEWVASDAPEVAALRAYAFRVLDAVGMRYGASHIEIMATSQGPRLVEIGARPHGGGHPQFCRSATGDSQVDRLVRCFVEDQLVCHGYDLKTHLTIVFLMCRRSGVVSNRAALDAVASLPSCHFAKIAVKQGDRLAPTKDLFASLALGFVALAHPDPAQIAADTRAIRALEARLFD